MKLLLDFFPVVAFFVAYQIADIYVATATIMAAMVVQIIILWLWKRSIGRMVLLSTLLVLIFGSITLWLRDGIFIQWKPTVIYILLALGFSGAQLLTKSTPMERLMGETITINSAIWKKINVMWIGVFLFLAEYLISFILMEVPIKRNGFFNKNIIQNESLPAPFTGVTLSNNTTLVFDSNLSRP